MVVVVSTMVRHLNMLPKSVVCVQHSLYILDFKNKQPIVSTAREKRK